VANRRKSIIKSIGIPNLRTVILMVVVVRVVCSSAWSCSGHTALNKAPRPEPLG